MRELGKRYAQQMLKLEGFEFKEAERPGLLAPAANYGFMQNLKELVIGD
jgi:hypothetical protein